MSSSIAIPASASSAQRYRRSQKHRASPSDSCYSVSPTSSSPSTSPKDKQRMPSQRRQSLLSSAFSKEETTTFNIADPEAPPRLISFLSSSQGFDWNPEIFLPSYLDCDYVPLEARREPVHEIIVSDDEVKNMLPS